MSIPYGTLIHGSVIGRESSMISVPNYNYYDHAPKGQRESDRAYFENKHGQTQLEDRRKRKRVEAKAQREKKRQELEAKHRDQMTQARDLHIRGFNYAEIASELGVSTTRAHELCDDEYARRRREQKNACDRERRRELGVAA